jgi:RimJ/RimL family protein N-acetyltransferase
MLTDIDLDSLMYIVFNMRPEDKEEIYALLPHNEPYQLGWEAFMLFRNKGRSQIAWHQGKPAAVIAITECRKGVWEISMFGTEDFKSVALPCMRWARDTIPDLIINHHGRRLQCDSHANHEAAHRFLKALGARPEGPPMKYYGKDGSAFIRFVWLFGENGFVSQNGKAVGPIDDDEKIAAVA